jgi:choline dehydrogenase-like flavoprotein
LAQRKLPSVVLIDRRATYPLDVNAEQEPNPDSRVGLGGERDALGMRRLIVDWRTTAEDHHRLAEGMRVMQRAVASSGTVRIDLGEDLDAVAARRVPVGGHHIGTARMASDPSAGVCDANAELFGTRGVFLAGAAVFPTSGFANPTLVMLALALRLAEYLRQNR